MENNKMKPKFAIYYRQIMNENGEQEGEEESLVVRYPEGIPLPDLQNLITQFMENQGVRPFSSGYIEKDATLNDVAKAMDNSFNAIYG